MTAPAVFRSPSCSTSMTSVTPRSSPVLDASSSRIAEVFPTSMLLLTPSSSPLYRSQLLRLELLSYSWDIFGGLSDLGIFLGDPGMFAFRFSAGDWEEAKGLQLFDGGAVVEGTLSALRVKLRYLSVGKKLLLQRWHATLSGLSESSLSRFCILYRSNSSSIEPPHFGHNDRLHIPTISDPPPFSQAQRIGLESAGLQSVGGASLLLSLGLRPGEGTENIDDDDGVLRWANVCGGGAADAFDPTMTELRFFPLLWPSRFVAEKIERPLESTGENISSRSLISVAILCSKFPSSAPKNVDALCLWHHSRPLDSSHA
mmetsp:Transcript_37777/g.51164  ORF Transcript_37777/g.51164 Transcript_37777/m.51164 type:complete len:315 (+) Transcript_37777:1164-2108(+)